MNRRTIALAGNPNCGKTTVFNALTGLRQHVGNWPGVTVERVTGKYSFHDTVVETTDLPGIYSFSALSPDEEVARRHILLDTPDIVVNVIDASNLERNLYLTVQLLEMNAPVVVVLNMIDMARKRGIHIEVDHLARRLGCPVIPIVASRKKGIEELKKSICNTNKSQCVQGLRVPCEKKIEKVLQTLESDLAETEAAKKVPARWLAIKLAEKDKLAEEILGAERRRLSDVENQLKKVERIVGKDADMLFADARYEFIHALVRDVTQHSERTCKIFSDKIDKVLLHNKLGVPLFFLIMYMVFALTINVGGPFIDFFDRLMGTIFVDGAATLLEKGGFPGWSIAILADGLGGGVQTISTFIPPIFLIFLCLSLLEDSGYMARAAFVMDGFLRRVGLPGKAFIPMMIGFGCNVQGITATRTLENRKDRILAIIMNPFMSCGARLPVYTLFATAFFPKQGGLLIFGIYMTGIALAILTGLLFRKTILCGEASSLVMELPPYHMPTFSGVLLRTWHRLKSFLVKAGRMILLLVAVLGFLNSIGTDGSFRNNDSRDSLLSVMSRSVTPIFRPMGIQDENWPASVGLFTGIFAKEVVVGTLDAIYSQLETQEKEGTDTAEEEIAFNFKDGIVNAFAAIPAGYAEFFKPLLKTLGFFGAHDGAEEPVPASYSTMVTHFGENGKHAALAYLLFILIYAPCVSALAAIYREIGLGWMLLTVSYLTLLAWVVATAYYQIATFTENPFVSLFWLTICVFISLAFFIGLRIAGREKKIKRVGSLVNNKLRL